MGSHDPAFVKLCDDARAQIREVTIDEVHEAQAAGKAMVLVDVREDREWAVDRCAGAVHLGRGVLERDITGQYPDRATPLVLYCGGGYRSALAARDLQLMGYTDVASMAGGIRAWRAAGYPIEPGP